MENKFFHILVFTLFLLGGAYFTSGSWNGITYVYMGDGDERLPAAVQGGIDFSALKGTDFFLASKNRILEEAKVIYQDEGAVGIELGHFLTRNHRGDKEFACKKYSNVQLQFVAVGVAENGESPTMDIDGDCAIGKSVSKIEPIWIPVSKLLLEKPGNIEFQLNQPYNVTFRFDHIGSQWPKSWVLQGVHLYSKTTGERLSISSEEIRASLESPIRFSWGRKPAADQ